MEVRRATKFFKTNPLTPFTIGGLSCSLNNSLSDIDIADKELSAGENIISDSDSSAKKRGGITLYGQFMGALTGIVGGWNSVFVSGVQERVVAYNTSLMRDLSGVWTALTGVTLTSGKVCDAAYFDFTDKLYVVNQTDNVVKYAGSTSADQTDAAFTKGKYIISFQNRLIVANTASYPNRMYYTQVQSDTMQSNGWVEVPSEITGIINYFGMVIISTKRKLYKLSNFAFDGTNSWIQNLTELPVTFGAIYEKTIAIANNYLYFLGQEDENVAAIYVCDGYNTNPVSDAKIEATMASLSPTLLASACAIGDAHNFRVYVGESGQSSNNIGIVYNTVKQIFYPIERRFVANRADFSCLFSSEVSGVWTIFAGTSGTGQVYKLNQNDGLYDELGEERYLVNGTYNVPVDANPAKRAAQSFKLSNYDTTQVLNISKVVLQLKKNAGTTTGLTVQICADNAGAPGTVLGTTTLAAVTSTNYAYYNAVFTTPVSVSGGTTYWIVLKTTVEGSGSSQIYWLADSCTASYSYGNLSTYSSGVWHSDTISDASFVLYIQSPIDAYLDTKAFLPNNGLEFKLHKFLSIFSTSGNYNVEIGISKGGFNIFQTYFVSLLSSAGGNWDDGVSKWDDGVSIWDGQPSRIFPTTTVESFTDRTCKVRVRNRQANQQFEFNKIILSLAGKGRN